MERPLKIILAALLFICLLDMPYGYYQLVRFIGMAGFAYLAFVSFDRKEAAAGYIFMLLALLFQPFFKVVLGRGIWNMVDVIVGAGLVLSLFNKPPKS